MRRNSQRSRATSDMQSSKLGSDITYQIRSRMSPGPVLGGKSTEVFNVVDPVCNTKTMMKIVAPKIVIHPMKEEEKDGIKLDINKALDEFDMSHIDFG